MPIIAPNNTTGLYGIDTTVQINNAVTGNSLNIQGNATIQGNLAVDGAITAAGNIAGNYILGNGSQLTGLPEVYGNANVSNYLASGTNTANMITTGNIAGTFFLGNGSQLTGIQTDYGNANVTSLLAGFGSNTISTTGNIGGGNITGTHIGSGAGLTSITGANVTGTVANAAFATTAGSSGSATTATTAGTVTDAAQPNITSVGTLTSLSSSGNITGANVIGTHFGSGAALTSLTGANVTGTVANATQSETALSAGFATTAGSATTAGTVTTAAQPNITSVGTLSSLSVTGNITGGNINTGGNVQAAFFKGNGSQLTGVTATTTTISNGGSNVTILTPGGNINFSVPDQQLAMQILETTGRVRITSSLDVLGPIDSNSTITATGNIVGGNLRTAGQISSTGNILSGNINTGGRVSATGNILGGNISAALGTVSGLVGNFQNIDAGGISTQGLVDVGGELEVAGNISAPLSNISGGNIRASGSGVGFISATASISAGGNIVASGNITANTNIQALGRLDVSGVAVVGGEITSPFFNTSGSNGAVNATGNITGANIIGTHFGSGANLTNLPGANVTGTVANATFATTAGSATTATTAGTVTTNAQPNITSVGTLSSLSASGNIATGAFFIGDGSQLTNLPSGGTPGGNTTEVQFNNAGAFAGDSLFTWDTANAVAEIGNIKITAANNNIQNVNAWNPNTTPQQARITVGTGYDGDFSITRDPIGITRGAQLAVINKQVIGNADTNQSVRAVSGVFYADMNGATLTNSARRMQSGQFALAIGNGTQQMPAASPVYAAAAAAGGALQVGNITIGGSSTFADTSTTLGHGTAALNNALIGGNATVGNLVASVNQLQFFTNNTGNVQTGIGTASAFAAGFSGQPEPENVYGYYMPGTVNNHGVTNSAFWRRADNYYFLMNEDDVAQNQLGSLRAYHTYSFVAATSGTVNIDKNNGQAQYIAPTGNITIGDFQNFVTSASDSINTDFQNDTVTVVVNQSATPYTVTMPTGNSSIRYSGGVSTVSSTADSVSTITITAYNNGSGSVYFVNIATTDAATTPAAGDSISPLMLMGG
jgi:hypothetical protein